MPASAWGRDHDEARGALKAALQWWGRGMHCSACGRVAPDPSHFISAALMPAEMCCRLGNASRSLLCHGCSLVTTPDVSSFFLFWAASLSPWLSAVSVAAKALAEPSVSPVFCLRTIAISECCYLSCRAAVSSCFKSRCRNERYLWDGHAMLLARETSVLFGMNAPSLLRCWGCHICREFGKAACSYIGIYLNQIQRLSSIACAENAAVESQAFSVALSTITIFNADGPA